MSLGCAERIQSFELKVGASGLQGAIHGSHGPKDYGMGSQPDTDCRNSPETVKVNDTGALAASQAWRLRVSVKVT